MKLISFIIPFTALFASASSTIVKYDHVYDDPNTPMTVVECSGGENGMIAKGYNIFGDLPTFPNIGAAFAVEEYNSPSCGSCWNLTDSKTFTTAFIIAIDRAVEGFVIAEEALTALGGPQAVDGGEIYTSARLVEGSYCGL